MEPINRPWGVCTQQPPLKEILYKLVRLMEIERVYLNPAGSEAPSLSVLIITVQDQGKGPLNKLLPMVHKIVLGYPGFYYRVYHPHHIAAGIKNGNLFFINGCTPKKMVFCSPLSAQVSLPQHLGPKNLLLIARHNFNLELDKAMAFWEGADFYSERGMRSQATFMLHQTIELLFRTLGRFMTGKEKVCHHIGSHQNYIRPFVPALGKLFDQELAEEAALLQLLDRAYVAVRYGDGYQITTENLQSIQSKATWMYKEVERLFKNSLDSCQDQLKNKSHGNQ